MSGTRSLAITKGRGQYRRSLSQYYKALERQQRQGRHPELTHDITEQFIDELQVLVSCRLPNTREQQREG